MTGPTATGWRTLDLAVVAAAVSFLLATSGALKVYFTVTPTRVDVARVLPDGTREAVDTPEPLRGVLHGVDRTRRRVDAFRATPAGRELARPATRLEWRIEYSRDSLEFDRVEVVP